MSVAKDIEEAVVAIIQGLNLASVTVRARPSLNRQQNDEYPLVLVKCRTNGSEPGLNDENARIRGFYLLDVVIYDKQVQIQEVNDFLEECKIKIRDALFQPIAGTAVDAIDQLPNPTANLKDPEAGMDTAIMGWKIETLEPIGA